MTQRYMIHACPKRMWYVDEYLVPQMIAQGIREDQILIRCDEEQKGNMAACMERFAECSRLPGGTWHIQDDVLLCHDFAERTKDADEMIQCGFMHRPFEPLEPIAGKVPGQYMWNSFPCIYIPNRYLKEFILWFYSDAMYREQYQKWIESKKHDDGFWKDFISEEHSSDFVLNMKPALVEHVDFLLGGSVANRWRTELSRAEYWEEPAAVDNLKRKLASRYF